MARAHYSTAVHAIRNPTEVNSRTVQINYWNYIQCGWILTALALW